MNPADLVPAADAIPVSWGWFQFFLILTFMLHLIVMNAMLGSGIIALVSSLPGKKAGTKPAGILASSLPYTIAFTVNLGVAPLLFVQVLYGQFLYTSSILMGWFWLTVIALLILAYYSAYIFYFRSARPEERRVLFLGLSVLFMLVIAFFFTNNMTLMLRPEVWPQYFDKPGGTMLNLSDPTLFPRYLHFVTASVAMGGLFLALLGRLGRGTQENERRVSTGMRWFSYATMVQAAVGILFFIMLPWRVMLLFMGGHLPATILLPAGVVLTLLAIVFGLKKKVWPAAGVTLLLIFGMVLMRDIVRTAFLQPYFHPSQLTVEAQYSPLVFFLATLVIGTGAVIYMLLLVSGNRREPK